MASSDVTKSVNIEINVTGQFNEALVGITNSLKKFQTDLGSLTASLSSLFSSFKGFQLPKSFTGMIDGLVKLNGVSVPDINKLAIGLRSLADIKEFPDLQRFADECKKFDGINVPNMKQLADGLMLLGDAATRLPNLGRNVTTAVNALTKLDKFKLPNVKNVSEGIAQLNALKIETQLGTNIELIAEALKKLDGISVPKIDKIALSVQEISALHINPQFATNLNTIAQALGFLSEVKLPNIGKIVKDVQDLTKMQIKQDFVTNLNSISQSLMLLEDIKLPNINGIVTGVTKLTDLKIKQDFVTNLNVISQSLEFLSGIRLPNVGKLTEDVQKLTDMRIRQDFVTNLTTISSALNFLSEVRLPNVGKLTEDVQKLTSMQIHQDFVTNLALVANALEMLNTVRIPNVQKLIESIKELTGMQIHQDFITNLNLISNALGFLSGIKTPDMKGFVTGVMELEKLKNVGEISDKIKTLATGMRELGSLRVPNLGQFVKGLHDIEKMNVSEVSKKLMEIVVAINKIENSGHMETFSRFAKSLEGLSGVLAKVSDGMAKVSNATATADTTFGRLGTRIKNYAQYTIVASIVRSIEQAFRSVIPTMMEYDQTMKDVQAITGATETQTANLGKMMQTLLGTTRFSMDELHQGMIEFAQSGFSANQILEAMPKVAQLAAGTLGTLSDAINLSTSAIKVFDMDISETGHVADVFAVAVNRSKLTIDGLKTAFNYVGPVAAEAGVSFEDLNAAMMSLGNAGMKASSIGTGLRQVFNTVLTPTKALKNALEEAGVSIDQIDPRLHSFQDVLYKLKDVVGSSKEAFDEFGKRGASAILAMTGTDNNLAEMTDALNQSGISARMAGTQSEGLESQWKMLENQAKLLIISMGESGLTGILKGFVSGTTKALHALGEFANSPLGKITEEIGLFYAAIKAYDLAKWGIGLLKIGESFTDLKTKTVEMIATAKIKAATTAQDTEATLVATEVEKKFSLQRAVNEAITRKLSAAEAARLAALAGTEGVEGTIIAETVADTVAKEANTVVTLADAAAVGVLDTALVVLKSLINPTSLIFAAFALAIGAVTTHMMFAKDASEELANKLEKLGETKTKLDEMTGSLKEYQEKISGMKKGSSEMAAANLTLRDSIQASLEEMMKSKDANAGLEEAAQGVLNAIDPLNGAIQEGSTALKEYFEAINIAKMDNLKESANKVEDIFKKLEGHKKGTQTLLNPEGKTAPGQDAQADFENKLKQGQATAKEIDDYLKSNPWSKADEQTKEFERNIIKLKEATYDMLTEFRKTGQINMYESIDQVKKFAEEQHLSATQVDILVEKYKELQKIALESHGSLKDWNKDVDSMKKGEQTDLQKGMEDYKKGNYNQGKPQAVSKDDEKELANIEAKRKAIVESAEAEKKTLQAAESDSKGSEETRVAAREKYAKEMEAINQRIAALNKETDQNEVIRKIQSYAAIDAKEKEETEKYIKENEFRKNKTVEYYDGLDSIQLKYEKEKEKIAKGYVPTFEDVQKQIKESHARTLQELALAEMTDGKRYKEIQIQKAQATIDEYSQIRDAAINAFAEMEKAGKHPADADYDKALKAKTDAIKNAEEQNAKITLDAVKDREESIKKIDALQSKENQAQKDSDEKKAYLKKSFNVKIHDDEQDLAKKIGDINLKLNQDLAEMEKQRFENHRKTVQSIEDIERHSADLIRGVNDRNKSPEGKDSSNKRAADQKLEQGSKDIKEGTESGDASQIQEGQKLVQQAQEMASQLKSQQAAKSRILEATEALVTAQKSLAAIEDTKLDTEEKKKIDEAQKKIGDDKNSTKRKEQEETDLYKHEVQMEDERHAKEKSNLDDEIKQYKDKLEIAKKILETVQNTMEKDPNYVKPPESKSGPDVESAGGGQPPSDSGNSGNSENANPENANPQNDEGRGGQTSSGWSVEGSSSTASSPESAANQSGADAPSQNANGGFPRLQNPFITSGSGTKDDVPALLTKGEFVQKKKAVDYYGKDFMEDVNNLQYPKQFATGGDVDNSTTVQSAKRSLSSQFGKSSLEELTNIFKKSIAGFADGGSISQGISNILSSSKMIDLAYNQAISNAFNGGQTSLIPGLKQEQSQLNGVTDDLHNQLVKLKKDFDDAVQEKKDKFKKDKDAAVAKYQEDSEKTAQEQAASGRASDDSAGGYQASEKSMIEKDLNSILVPFHTAASTSIGNLASGPTVFPNGVKPVSSDSSDSGNPSSLVTDDAMAKDYYDKSNAWNEMSKQENNKKSSSKIDPTVSYHLQQTLEDTLSSLKSTLAKDLDSLTDKYQKDLDDLKKKESSDVSKVNTPVPVHGTILEQLFSSMGLTIPKFATGGGVGNPKGSVPGKDSVHALLTPNEYVINEKAVSHFGEDVFDSLNKFQIPKFNTGGMVGESTKNSKNHTDSSRSPKSENVHSLDLTINGNHIGQLTGEQHTVESFISELSKAQMRTV